jgi:serine/threonine protein kinase
MAFGRPPISDLSLQGQYEAVSLNLGRYGPCTKGIFVVKSRRDGKKIIQKRMAPHYIASGKAKNELSILRELQHRMLLDISMHSLLTKLETMTAVSTWGIAYMETCKTIWTIQDAWIGELAIWGLLKQLANAVAYLQYGIHDAVSATSPITGAAPGWRGVAHCDIRPWNIFLRSRGDGNNENFPDIVLGDFGLAQRANDNTTLNLGATEEDNYWRAFKLRNLNIESALDGWSIGAIIQTSCRLGTFEPAWLSMWAYLSPIWGVWGVGLRYSQELDEVVGALMFDVLQRRPQIREISPKIQLYSQQASRGQLTARMHHKTHGTISGELE